MDEYDFNMDRVAEVLRETHGIAAYVEMTGGGCATLFIGERDADGRYELLAGPGTYQHRDTGFSVASMWEFFIGPDDNSTPIANFGDSQEFIAIGPDPVRIAERIARLYTEHAEAAPLVESVKAEVLELARDGVIPWGVPSYSALHDYVDANMLGGIPDIPTTEDSIALLNRVTDRVDAWIRCGLLAEKEF